MTATLFKLGERAIDCLPRADGKALPGLQPGYLHEIHTSGSDRAAALAFALCKSGIKPSGAIVVVQMARVPLRAALGGEGLVQLGVQPSRLILVETENELDLLRAGLEAARCPGVELVLLETPGAFGKYDLTASRRLALAAEQSLSRVIVLRQDAEPRPSAAQTRWGISSAPSIPLEANAPGFPAVEAKLLRWRGGPAGRIWRLEWDVDHGTFREAIDDVAKQPADRAPMPGAVVPLFRMRESADGGGPDYPRAA